MKVGEKWEPATPSGCQGTQRLDILGNPRSSPLSGDVQCGMGCFIPSPPAPTLCANHSCPVGNAVEVSIWLHIGSCVISLCHELDRLTAHFK